MTKKQVSEHAFDDWLKDDSDVAALVLHQWLEPVEGKGAVIFPPTYPIQDEPSGYNIDRFDDGTSVCQIDSVGSQANRMEPIFKRGTYAHLIPQVEIKATTDGKETTIHLCDAGHRAADALVRFSTIGPRLHETFRAIRDDGNAMPLAKIAPTSIVFGAWDSRSTQAKLPRIVRSVIRAYNVKKLRRSAQYSTIAGEILEGGDAEVTTKGPKAELGLAHVPAVHTHGGVLVLGGIRRDATLNLAAIRALRALPDDKTLKLRRYILGLALVSLSAPMDSFLREGCQLVPDDKQSAEWKLVKHDGTRTSHTIASDDALGFATSAATAFGVEKQGTPYQFDSDVARKVLALSEADRKTLLKQGAITKEAIERLRAGTTRSSRGGGASRGRGA
jgi:CRISPR-associated protein Csb1